MFSGGYTGRTRYSIMAVKWLSWMEHSEEKQIQHARNGREMSICGFFVDGYEHETRTIYEFHGCKTHSYQNCHALN